MTLNEKIKAWKKLAPVDGLDADDPMLRNIITRAEWEKVEAALSARAEGARTQEFDPEGAARWNAVRRAAQFAFDQQTDDPAIGDWNAACLHISEKLRAGESEKPPQRDDGPEQQTSKEG